MEIKNIQFNAINSPDDSRNIKFSEIAWEWESIKVPSEYYMKYPYISNQWSSMDCTAHSQSWASNENNGMEASKYWWDATPLIISPYELWDFGRSIWKITSEWGYINWAFKYLIKWWYITWYTVVSKTEAELKKAILRNWALVTWSNSITWNRFLPWWVAIYEKNSPWHAFRIDWWNDKIWAFRVTNSWWEDWWDKWFFWIKYQDIKYLYTVYAFHDTDDESKILRAKAKKLWVWNGVDENIVATRKECVIIASRIAWKIGTDYDLISLAILSKVINWERMDDKVTLFEAKLIFSRLWVKKTPRWVTRWELVETIS